MANEAHDTNSNNTMTNQYRVGHFAPFSLSRCAHVTDVPIARRGTARWFTHTDPAVPTVFGVVNADGGNSGAVPPQREQLLGRGGEGRPRRALVSV